eukprot:SAG31_NODE_45782_length_257_cov_0.949367_1_plen_43_part_10
MADGRHAYNRTAARPDRRIAGSAADSCRRTPARPAGAVYLRRA